MEARFRRNKKITTKDFEREVEFLKSTGKMPSLDQVLAAMAQAGKEYRDAVIAARKHRNLRSKQRN
jgi:hypothetical protein